MELVNLNEFLLFECGPLGTRAGRAVAKSTKSVGFVGFVCRAGRQALIAELNRPFRRIPNDLPGS
jgi:hypothetical protein